MRDACYAYAQQAAEAEAVWADLRVEAAERDILLSGRTGQTALVSHWAFGQLSARAEAPASYLRTLPATLAAQNLNYGLARRDNGGHQAQLLFHGANGNGDGENLVLRAATTDIYSRVWNYEICDRLLVLEDQGWTPAQPTMNIGIGGDRAMDPSLYASDHDMFAFIVAPDRVIKEPGSDEGLYRGVIFGNSEVGAASLWAMWFLYRSMCGNHIIWGAEDVSELRIAHKGGKVRDQFQKFTMTLRKYLDSSASDDEAKIAASMTTEIAATKDEVLDKIFGIRQLGMSRKLIAAGYDATVPDQDGSPNTQWGLVQGLTRHAQTEPFADKRQEIDRAAGKLLRIDF
jgi:hypothetical protein